jgi:DNA ligase (NAD+)
MTRETELAYLIRHHSELYFNGEAVITDAEFDGMVAEMKAINPDHEVLAEVGAEPTYGKKITHPSIMGSLSKATYGDDDDINDLISWRNEVAIDDEGFICMPKIDGLAVRLVYEDRKLVLAATRGNGTVGQDVTDNVKHIKSIPNRIPISPRVELRGEIYMTNSVFESFKEDMEAKGEKVPANPRNMASGVLNQKDPKKSAKAPLNFFCYDVDVEGHSFESEMNKYLYIENELPEIEYVPMTFDSFDSKKRMMWKINEWEEKRADLNYNIDGLVFSLNNVDSLEELGYKGKCPVGKVAFKFRPVQAGSEILDIDWQLGRTGKLTPVAKIVPTMVDGSTIDSPTLHNYAQIIEKKVSIGAKVIIEKAGDIIPQVVQVTEEGTGNINEPKICPACLDDVHNDGTTIWCKNWKCPGKMEHRVIHYLKTLEIMDVGPATVHDMFVSGMVSDLPDLYKLDFEKLCLLEGYGKRSARKIVKAIYDKKEIELATFLEALGVDGLGKTTSKAIANEYMSLENVLRVYPDKLEKIEGIGEKTAQSITDGLVLLGGTIDELLVLGVKPKPVEKIEGNLTGKTFCVTGTLSVGRKEMQAEIEAHGGVIKSSVSKSLDYLVAGEGVGRGKTDKADKYGTTIISEEELRAMF